MEATLLQRLDAEEALHREHFAERVGDRGARGQHQRTAGVLGFNEAGLDVEVPRPLRARRIDPLQARHVGGKGELAELLGLVDDDLIDTELGNGQKIVLARRERFEPFLESLFQPLEPFARDAIVAFDLRQKLLVELEFVGDHLLLERGRNRDEPERRMGDDDRVPIGCGGAGEEAMPLFLCKVGLVGNEDAGGRVERQDLARRLGEAVTGNDEHRLGDQPEPLLLHDGGRHGHGLAGADGVGEIGRTRRDDTPDAAFLVSIKRKGA